MSYFVDSREDPYDELDRNYRKLAKEHERLKKLLIEACDHLNEKVASKDTPISDELYHWYRRVELKRTIDLAQNELNMMGKEEEEQNKANEST